MVGSVDKPHTAPSSRHDAQGSIFADAPYHKEALLCYNWPELQRLVVGHWESDEAFRLQLSRAIAEFMSKDYHLRSVCLVCLSPRASQHCSGKIVGC